MSRDIDNLIAKAKLDARAEQIMQDFELEEIYKKYSNNKTGK